MFESHQFDMENAKLLINSFHKILKKKELKTELLDDISVSNKLTKIVCP